MTDENEQHKVIEQSKCDSKGYNWKLLIQLHENNNFTLRKVHTETWLNIPERCSNTLGALDRKVTTVTESHN